MKKITKQAPVQDAKQAPAQDSKQAPVQDSKQAPVQDAKQAPVQDAKQAPVQDAKQAPVQDTKQALLQAIQDTQKELITIIQKGKLKASLVSDMLQLCHKYIVAYGDKSFLINLFFSKVGKTTLFNALQLRKYYLEQEIVIEYNAKKDKLYVIGNVEGIKESFTDYKKRLSQERKKELDNLTDKEKIKKTFKSKIEALTDKQKTYLLDLIK